MDDPVEHSGGVAFRVPLLPLSAVADLTGGAAYDAWRGGHDLDAAVGEDLAHLDGRLRALLADDVVRAAVAYASPDLDAAVTRWLDGAAPLPRGLLGYVARMAGRSVPYGLFAGCASGRVEGEPAFRLGGERRVRTRLDVLAAERLAARAVDAAPDAVTFVPNATAHVAGDRLRLVEREVAGDAVRYHPLTVEENDAVALVLAAARDGARLPDLARTLAGAVGAPEEEAYGFVRDLVGAQLLVPDVPLVTGEPPAVAPGVVADVAAAERAAFDAEPAAPALRAAVAAVRDAVDVPRWRAVHVDLSVPGEVTLGDEVLGEALRAVGVLHSLFREGPVDADLAAFREAYAARYGDAETPLLEVLDPELGIGFGPPPAVAAVAAPLLAGFTPARSTDGPRWTPVDHHLVDLLSRALRDGADEIDLGPADLHPLRNQRPRPLPPSLALVATVVAASEEAVAAGDFRLVVHGATGPNATATFSRFAPLDAGLDALARRHAAEEQRRAAATLAEVVHLPDGRRGNVAVRPPLRDAEIPVLAAGTAAERIAPSRLRVSVRDGRVVLRDDTGREVAPRVSAAYDSVTSPLPLYRFLASVQRDGTAWHLRWSWGQVDAAPFLPRVVVGRLVLARAGWRWFRDELRELSGARTTAERFAAAQRLRERWGLPRWATLARGDNEMPLDLDGVAAAELLAREARRAGQLTVREQLPGPDELCLTGPGGAYVHEVVLPLHGPAPRPAPRARPAPAAYVPGSEWLGVEVAAGHATADAVLREVVAPLVGATRWFYERGDGLLRLRVQGDAAALLGSLRDRLAPLVASGRVGGVRLDTYRPGIAHAVAHADSVAALRLVALGDDLDARWRAALEGVDALLRDAGLDAEGRRDAVRGARDALVRAHGETGQRALRHAGRVHRARRHALAERDAYVAAVLEERSRAAAPVLAGAGAEVLEAACAAHVNRMLRAAHDLQAIVLYDLLDRRYRSLTRPGRGR